MPKTIFRQIDELFSMCKGFKRRRKGVPKHLITSAATFNIYRDACMRFAKDLAERRGTKKFQIVSITSKEVQNFLERIKIAYRPETVHQYTSALQKLQHMVNKKYCKIGNAAVESVFEGKKDVTTPKSHHLESRERRLEVVQRSLMEASEIIQMDSLDCIGLIQWCYPLYMKKVGWTYLPQADGIKKAGKLEVSRLVQPRGFDVEIPDIPLRKRKLRFKK